MGSVLLLLFSVTFLQCFGLSSATDIDGKLKIYGGNKILIKDAPFIAALFVTRKNNKTYFCGGSIVSDSFILTAAHCLRNLRSVAPLSVAGFVGSSNLHDPCRILIYPEQKFCHPDYDIKYDYNDICLIKLKSSLTFGTNVARVVLPFEHFNLVEGVMVNVTGWGFTENSHDVQPDLRQAKVPISIKNCRNKRKTVICAGSEGHTSCNADSGGPLTYGRVLVGVISGGLHHTCGKVGSYHTRVSSYLKWIKTTMNNH